MGCGWVRKQAVDDSPRRAPCTRPCNGRGKASPGAPGSQPRFRWSRAVRAGSPRHGVAAPAAIAGGKVPGSRGKRSDRIACIARPRLPPYLAPSRTRRLAKDYFTRAGPAASGWQRLAYAPPSASLHPGLRPLCSRPISSHAGLSGFHWLLYRLGPGQATSPLLSAEAGSLLASQMLTRVC